MPRPAIALVALLLLPLLAACSLSREESGANTPVAIEGTTVGTAAGQPRLRTIPLTHQGGTLHVELAATAQERQTGLGGRTAMGADEGMLFDLGDNRIASFWMKDTLIPLDMVWIAEDMRVTGVEASVQPQPGASDADLRSYTSQVPVRYVLELNAGEAARRGIGGGSLLEFTP